MPQQNGTIFLRLLLNKYFSGKPEQLAKIMPKEEWEHLSSIALSQREPSSMCFVPSRWLSSIDPSWLAPSVARLPKPLQEVYAKAFPKICGGGVAPEKEALFSETVQDFLISYLHSVWGEKEAPPKELLPSWELSPLLECTKEQIMDIVDLLAMHDLVEEMRHIVDKKQLLLVGQYLSPEQQHYVRTLLRQKSRQEPSTLSVRELLKEGKKFSQSLHKFGLGRLGLALSGASDDFLWHILHTFDVARAKFLQSHIKNEEVPNKTRQAILQVQHCIQFLKTETTP